MKKYSQWLTALAIITVGFGTIYATVQQSLRLSANDPQIQLAEDTASSLNGGTSPSQLVSITNINADKSLAPFVAVYDKSGTLLATNGSVAGGAPHVPFGVLKAARGKEYNAVTWQPSSSVRLAAVSVRSNNYYVLSARSLKQVEKREDKTLLLSAIGWLLAIVVLGVGYIVSSKAIR